MFGLVDYMSLASLSKHYIPQQARDNCETKTHCADDRDCPEFEFCWTQTPCDYYATEMPTTYPPSEGPSKKPKNPKPTQKPR